MVYVFVGFVGFSLEKVEVVEVLYLYFKSIIRVYDNFLDNVWFIEVG